MLTLEEKWKLIGSGYKRVRENVKTSKPDFIGGLYQDIPFPCLKDGNTYINTETENTYNGSLKYGQNEVVMTWEGYVSQLRDGELKMSPLSQETSTIKGTCNGINFEFRGSTLLFGVWPGFLLIYEKEKFIQQEMSSNKKREREEKRKGIRVVCTIQRIEEFDMKEDDVETIVLTPTETIGTITTPCDMALGESKTKITFPGFNELAVVSDDKVGLKVNRCETVTMLNLE